MELRGKKINFLGDSITEGAGVSEWGNLYFNILKREESLSEARCYGVSGTRISRQIGGDSVNNRGDEDFILRAEKMDDDADCVVVFGGTNDYGHGNAPIGRFDDKNPYTFYGACRTLTELLINKYPEALIVFMLPLHRLNEDSPVYAQESGAPAEPGSKKPLKVYCDIISEVAAYYSVPVLDLYSVSGIQPAVDILREKYMPDGLHPNDEGHRLIASRLAGFLKSL